MKSKLTSRKFWAAAVGVIMGIALAFGVDGDTITSVAGAVTSLLSIVVYILAEAGVDRVNVSTENATFITNYNNGVLEEAEESEAKE